MILDYALRHTNEEPYFMQLETQHADAIAHYRHFGFAHFKQVIPNALLHDIKSYLVDELSQLDALCQQRHQVSLYDADELASTFQGKLDQIPRDDRFLFSGEFPTKTRLESRVEQILKCSQLNDLAKFLLECQTVFAHLPVMARYIMPHNRISAVPPHRDDQYNSHMSNFVTVWIPLVDIDEQCGGVNFYPQTPSERRTTATIATRDEYFWQAPISVENMASEMPQLSVGDILIFTPDVIHGSAANTSSQIRYSLDIRLFSERDTSSKFNLNLTTGERISPVEK